MLVTSLIAMGWQGTADTQNNSRYVRLTRSILIILQVFEKSAICQVLFSEIDRFFQLFTSL
jgi:hypothetical protein